MPVVDMSRAENYLAPFVIKAVLVEGVNGEQAYRVYIPDLKFTTLIAKEEFEKKYLKITDMVFPSDQDVNALYEKSDHEQIFMRPSQMDQFHVEYRKYNLGLCLRFMLAWARNGMKRT